MPRHHGSFRREDSPLCCCEFINAEGDQVHLLQFCCDCEALDATCDRIFKCERIPNTLLGKVMATILDRCRIPWIGGAAKINCDVIAPCVIIPTCLLLATLHAYVAAIIFTLLPIGMYIFYRQWIRNTRRTRTQFFFSWAMVSLLLSFTVFEVMALGLREILLWENLTVVTLTLTLIYAIYMVKQDPGYMTKQPKSQVNGQAIGAQQRTVSVEHKHKHKNSDLGDFEQPVDSTEQTHHRDNTNITIEDRDIQNHPIGSVLVNNFGFQASEFHEKKLAMKGDILYQDDVTWLDSRSFRDGQLVMYCASCQVRKTPRSGHCTVCNACVQGRDHHCVWIDSCIGVNNHCAFLVAMILFIATGCYGSHLALTSVCTPEMYFDWFLWPNDCRFVYSDFLNAIIFVSAMYSNISCSLMCFALIQQIILISQNLTGQEIHMASLRGWVRHMLWAQNNVNNHGLWRNWRDFLTSRRSQTYGPNIH